MKPNIDAVKKLWIENAIINDKEMMRLQNDMDSYKIAIEKFKPEINVTAYTFDNDVKELWDKEMQRLNTFYNWYSNAEKQFNSLKEDLMKKYRLVNMEKLNDKVINLISEPSHSPNLEQS
jgi:hypothetical protein